MGEDDKERRAAAAAEEAAKAAQSRKEKKESNARKDAKSQDKGDRVSSLSPKAGEVEPAPHQEGEILVIDRPLMTLTTTTRSRDLQERSFAT